MHGKNFKKTKKRLYDILRIQLLKFCSCMRNSTYASTILVFQFILSHIDSLDWTKFYMVNDPIPSLSKQSRNFQFSEAFFEQFLLIFFWKNPTLLPRRNIS